ncbi:MAG: UDP-glucose 4-epimerase GalE [Deltaproteobacteria bacterium]|nr:UDP-glucose 4-epimerase GalE [Deltaproteobacteria bacterium]
MEGTPKRARWYQSSVASSLRVLVTGGAGYIGSHTARLLAEEGFSPFVLDDLGRGHREAARFGQLIVGDVGDAALVARVVRDHRIEAAVHFAAFAYVGESVRDPGLYWTNNTVKSLALVDALVGAGVRDVVFSSTCATYGDPRSLPLREDHPQAPVNAYGASKLAVEHILRSYGVAHGLRWMALRYFNAAGAHPDGTMGERHDPETHLVPLAIEAALGRARPLEIFGTDYDTPDGTALRDYVHVLDLADAHVRALRHLAQGGASGALNLGTGRGHSVREIVSAVEGVVGKPVPHTFGPRRAGDPPALVADPTNARTTLGWTPQYTDLRAIIETAARWHRRGA